MSEADDFATRLLDEAKRFLEKADDHSLEAQQAYLHASLTLGFCALEAHVNSIFADFSDRPEFNILEQSIMKELDHEIKRGELRLTNRLKMWRIQDRIQFLSLRLGKTSIDGSTPWWSQLSAGLDLRNDLTHPKKAVVLSDEEVARILQAIIDCLNHLYQVIYGRKLPAASRGLHSTLDF